MLSIVCSLVSQEYIKQFELWPNFNVDNFNGCIRVCLDYNSCCIETEIFQLRE